MHMHNSRVASSDDIFMIQNSQLCLEGLHRMDRLECIGDDETDIDILIVNAT